MDRRQRAADAYRRVRDGSGDGEPEGLSAPDEPAGDPEPSDDLTRGFRKTTRSADHARRGTGSVPDATQRDQATSDGARRDEDASDGNAHDTGSGEDAHASISDVDVTPLPPRDIKRVSAMLAGGGAERAARLLIALGSDQAAHVLRRLDPEQVEAVTGAIVRLRAVHREEAEAILGELAQSPREPRLVGGPQVAREFLTAAFGPEEGERRFFRTIPNAPARHFAFLNELEPGQLWPALKDEPASAAALVLAHVARPLAAGVLQLMPEERRADVTRRIARMGKLSRDVVVRVEEAVREKLRRQGSSAEAGVDGEATLASILEHLAPSQSDELLAKLREANVDLSESIRRRLSSTSLMLRLSDRHLADLLREFSDREVALFLKGKEQELRERVLRAMSERRAQSVSEEYAHMGARRRDEVDEITLEVLERMRELAEDGSILVPREGDHYI